MLKGKSTDSYNTHAENTGGTMIRNALILAAALGALTLAGCDIYFGPGTGSDCQEWGTCDDLTPSPGPAEPGEACINNNECAAGCACLNGACVETGFCDQPFDCSMGMECDTGRATCIPEGSNDGCLVDSDCAGTSYCDVGANVCVPSWGCYTASDCGPGWDCNPNGTCVPASCLSDNECFEGCACEVGSGVCQETGFCARDSDCSPWCNAAGECSNLTCDLDRGTCTFPQSNPASCGGQITCNQGAPVCGADETPAISDGCYTGECLAISQCDVPPLAMCPDIENANQCIGRPDCEALYTGRNCRCLDGGTECDCNTNPGACTCESYDYSCQSL